MKRVTSERLRILSELASRSPQEALALYGQYESSFGDDLKFKSDCAAVLIDIGSDLNEPGPVEQGIQRINDVVNEQGGDCTPSLFYHLANGYYTLQNLARLRADYRFDPDNTPLTDAKLYYRKALAKQRQLGTEPHAQLWVNYGNCLSGLGRAVEAISAYDEALKLVPDHPMALGNLGIELHHFAHIAAHRQLLLDARRKLDQALSDDRLESLGGSGARRQFEGVRDRTVAQLSRLAPEGDVQVAPTAPTFASDYQREYAAFCGRHQLFLNFCLRCEQCRGYAADSLSFPLTTDLDDDTTFIRLSRVVNEVKERYAFSRLLLFQALHPAFDTVPIDGMTAYVDNLDYAVYGTRVAGVKVAFESAYDVLDKIAHFINDYLKLGIARGPRLTFTTNGLLWREQQNPPLLRHRIRQLDNMHLLALYDVAGDLDIGKGCTDNDADKGHLRRIRNHLTHEYLVPHVEGADWTTEADSPDLHLLYSELVAETVDLMQLVRAAVIYLIAFIDLEERRKSRASRGVIAPMFAAHYDASLSTPALNLPGY